MRVVTLFCLLPITSAWILPASKLASSKERTKKYFASSADAPYPSQNSSQKLRNEPYVDPDTGKLSVDVSDLGVNMDDIGKKGWADVDRVHPEPGGAGMSSEGYVTLDGNIDWDAMARDLAMEDE